MNGKQLKNSILQWAIQGRLVPQDPNDEPASVLLQRIQAEKQQLVAEGKLKPKDLTVSTITRTDDNHYLETITTGTGKKASSVTADITEQIPFDIPTSWQWVRLKEIAELIGGYAFPSNTIKGDKGIRVIRISDISEEGFVNKSIVRYKGNNLLDNYKIKPYDILMAMTGGTVGKSLYVESLTEEMFLNQRVAIIRNKYGIVTYLNLVVKAPHIKEIINTRKNSTNDNISMADISNFLIPLPPLAEQQRIVDKIEQLMPIINQYAAAQDKLDALNNSIKPLLRKSILQEAIQGHLVPQVASEGSAAELLERIQAEKQQLVAEGKLKPKDLTASTITRTDDNHYIETITTGTGKKASSVTADITEQIPFDIPASWQWVRLGEYVKMKIGKTPARGDTAFWYKGEFSWVSISDMSDYGIIPKTKEKITETAAKQLMGEIDPKGTLLMSFKLTVGRTSILDIDAYHNEAIISIYPFIDKDYSTRNYLFYILPLISNYGESKDAIKGKTLNSQSLYNILLPLPPLAEQQRIVQQIETLFAKL